MGSGHETAGRGVRLPGGFDLFATWDDHDGVPLTTTSLMSRRFLLFVALFVMVLPLPALAVPDLDLPDQAKGPGVAGPVIAVENPVDRIHLAFPQDPDLTWFLDTFGHVRAGGHRHIGVDLHAPKGSPVYAVAAGVVIRMDITPRAGAFLVIDHGAGWESWYMHLDTDNPGTDDGRGGFAAAFAQDIAVGGFVDAGQLIGYVGDSGNAEHTMPHTHFELHRDGRPVDPFSMLVRAHERARMAVMAERLAALADRIV